MQSKLLDESKVIIIYNFIFVSKPLVIFENLILTINTLSKSELFNDYAMTI